MKLSQATVADTHMSKGPTLLNDKASVALCRAETLAEPYYTFRKRGYAVAFASIAGGPIPIDPYSLSPTIMKNYGIKTFMYDSRFPSSIPYKSKHDCLTCWPKIVWHDQLDGMAECLHDPGERVGAFHKFIVQGMPEAVSLQGHSRH